MRIRYAPPVKGDRVEICRGDEAIVSRIHAPGTPYDGMVERLQRIEERTDPRCFVVGGKRDYYKFLPKDIRYHLLRFLAGRLARQLFPGNFVDSTEIRISFGATDTGQAATYSDFVMDGNGAIERWKEIRRRARGMDWMASRGIAAWADKRERGFNPELDAWKARFENAGLHIAHAAANYHWNGNRTVFF